MIIVVLFQLRIFCDFVKFEHKFQLLFASMAEQETSTLSTFNPVKLTHIPTKLSNSIILEDTFCFIETYIPKSRGNGFLSCS